MRAVLALAHAQVSISFLDWLLIRVFVDRMKPLRAPPPRRWPQDKLTFHSLVTGGVPWGPAPQPPGTAPQLWTQRGVGQEGPGPRGRVCQFQPDRKGRVENCSPCDKKQGAHQPQGARRHPKSHLWTWRGHKWPENHVTSGAWHPRCCLGLPSLSVNRSPRSLHTQTSVNRSPCA